MSGTRVIARWDIGFAQMVLVERGRPHVRRWLPDDESSRSLPGYDTAPRRQIADDFGRLPKDLIVARPARIRAPAPEGLQSPTLREVSAGGTRPPTKPRVTTRNAPSMLARVGYMVLFLAVFFGGSRLIVSWADGSDDSPSPAPAEYDPGYGADDYYRDQIEPSDRIDSPRQGVSSDYDYGYDVDCVDVGEEVIIDDGDPSGLDADGDGIGCEGR